MSWHCPQYDETRFGKTDEVGRGKAGPGPCSLQCGGVRKVPPTWCRWPQTRTDLRASVASPCCAKVAAPTHQTEVMPRGFEGNAGGLPVCHFPLNSLQPHAAAQPHSRTATRVADYASHQQVATRHLRLATTSVWRFGSDPITQPSVCFRKQQRLAHRATTRNVDMELNPTCNIAQSICLDM